MLSVSPAEPSAELSTFLIQSEPFLNATATAGMSKTLVLTTRDKYGNVQASKMSESPAMLVAGPIQIPAGSFTYSFTYVGSGQYSANFLLLLAGRFHIQVLLGSKQVSKSPFACLVTPSFAVGPSSFNSSAVPSFVEAGQLAQFTVQVFIHVNLL